MRFSKFAHKFNKGEIHAFYHSLRMKPVYLHSNLFAYIEKIDQFQSVHELVSIIKNKDIKQQVEGAINALIRNKILIEKADYDNKVISRFRESITPPYIQIAYFILSERCNLACPYCFILKNDHLSNPIKDMPIEVALKSLDLFCRLIKKDLTRFNNKKTIIFYGGEPLLNFRVLKKLLKKIEKEKKVNNLPIDLDLTIITNGTLITEEIVDCLVKHNVSIAFSIDGDQYATNFNRRFKNNEPTYEKIRNAIKISENLGANISFSVTLTEASLANPEKTLNTIIYDLNARTLGFNILLTDKEYTVQKDYDKKASDFIINAYKAFRRNNIYEDRMMRKVKAFTKSEIYPFDCGATGGNQIVFAPDGQTGICHGFLSKRQYFTSNIDNTEFDPRESKDYLEWSKRSPLNIDECQNCSALGICGGGCPLNSYNNRGSIWELDERFCTHAKKTLNWLIWDLYANIDKSYSQENKHL